MTTTYRLKDTGLGEVGGSQIYTPVNSGKWLEIPTVANRYELTVQTSDFTALRTNETNTSLMDFKSNEVSALMAPRMNIRALVNVTDATKISAIINMGRSKGIKRLSGGMGVISGMPEKDTDTYDYINVLIKNITISEVLSSDDTYADITIQLEQVN
jgi:hypothetical protein